jgi:dTDP-4-dehydrorhamnose reductase
VKVLITGATGQLARALSITAPTGCTIAAKSHAQFDITDVRQVSEYIGAERPDILINAAAFTAVDRAESERERAYAINAAAVADLAQQCRSASVRLIHFSTDYVFDGNTDHAWDVDAPTHPINVYGASKLAGEKYILAEENLSALIVRTSWVYSPWGQNFLLTMLRVMRERGAARVVADQIGAPTSALNLARFTWQAAKSTDLRGVLHYSDGGTASWYEFAVAIAEEASAAHVLAQRPNVIPIASTDYPTAAKRPRFSLLATRSSLDRVGIEQPHWREGLREVMRQVRSEAT